MLRAAARLLRRQGYAATGWRQVVAEGNAPWGSQAHFFPGGKEQLAAEALTAEGERFRARLAAGLDGVHPADMVGGWAAFAAEQLRASDWADGCPIATSALETAHVSDALAARATVRSRAGSTRWLTPSPIEGSTAPKPSGSLSS